MSKRRDEEKWGPHAHCVVCGNAMPEGGKTCSEDCAQKFEEETKHYKRQQKMTYIVMFGMIAFIALFLILNQYL